MKTKFTPLVQLKHSKMQECELEVQKAYKKFNKAQKALEESINELEALVEPKSGSMHDFLAQRAIVDAQHRTIKHNQERLRYEQKQLALAKELLTKETIEYEKFNYLQTQEIQKIKKAIALKEAKNLDEVALMRFARDMK